jgi:long-chain acyl-CoA synthetase
MMRCVTQKFALSEIHTLTAERFELHHGLGESLQATAASFPERTAIRFAQRDISFAQLDALSGVVAGNLVQLGIQPADRVGLYCPNSDVFALAYLGIVKAGATVVPINLLLSPTEIHFILADSGCRGLIYHDGFSDSVTRFREGLDQLAHVVCVGERPASARDYAWLNLLGGGTEPPRLTVAPEDDVVSILYTSGTTGRPKGAMLTHRNLLSNTNSLSRVLDITPGDDVVLVVLPMFHAFAATVGMLLPMVRGCAFVPVPRFEPRLVVDTIADSGATIFLGVPSMYKVLMGLPDEAVERFSSVRVCISGGAAMPQELMRQFEHRFGLPIHEGDGPTECSPVTCVNPIAGVRKPGSVGLPIPGVAMSIRDRAGDEIADGEIGEICVRGDNVMKGYWNQPEETEAAFFRDWFRTGDLGYRDDDGYFYIIDRIKDMIIVNGMNVYPRVIEEVLYQHPSVTEAAVVGEPNELHGEIPVAFVSLEQDADADSQAVRAFCRAHLGRHEVPRKVFFLPELPKNAAGKILKRELRKHGELERGVDARAP